MSNSVCDSLAVASRTGLLCIRESLSTNSPSHHFSMISRAFWCGLGASLALLALSIRNDSISSLSVIIERYARLHKNVAKSDQLTLAEFPWVSSKGFSLQNSYARVKHPIGSVIGTALSPRGQSNVALP